MVLPSWPILQRELSYAFTEFCSTIVPPPDARRPITPAVLLFDVPLHFLPLVFLAYLARRPDTYLVRLLLFPVTALSSIHFGFGYQYTHPVLNVYNFAIALLSEYMLSRAILWAFTPEGMLKHTENSPGVPSKPPPATHDGEGQVQLEFDLRPRTNPNNSSPFANDTLSRALSDAFELLTTLRGLDFQFSNGTYIPTTPQTQRSRSGFLTTRIKSFVFHFLILDVLESLLKLVPGVGEASGGSIFLDSLSPTPRLILATCIHFITGLSILSGFEMVYNLITIVAVGILQIDPSKYPPAMEDPFRSPSLHEFWSKRWHQFFRTTFIILGGWPLSFITSAPIRLLSFIFPSLTPSIQTFTNLGLVFGTFIASGLFHETSFYAMGRGVNLLGPTMLFFAAQGPLLLLERLWRKTTGRRVGGTLGNLWVWTVLVVGAELMVDSWHMKGLGGGMIIFPWISPTRLIILPLLSYII